MNTYDFDKTIYNPDSSYSFVIFCLGKHPLALLRTLPATALKAVKYKLGIIETKELKEQVFSFLRYVDDIDKTVAEFWSTRKHRIDSWYLQKKRPDDIIISASPEFLLKPVCDELGVRLLGTPMDKKTGIITGLNCHDSEKVRRFYEAYPDGRTEEFYSDSLTDSPMAEIADKAFLVNKGKLSPWPTK